MGAGHVEAGGEQREEKKLWMCPGDAVVLALLSWQAAFLFHTLALVSVTWVPQRGSSGLALAHLCRALTDQAGGTASWPLP